MVPSSAPAPSFRNNAVGISAALAFFLADARPAQSATAGWKLDWSDEFAAAPVNAAVWGFENGFVRNEEAQFYSDRVENSRIEDGRLLIRALRDDWNGHEYTSASRTTRNKKSWKYGRFELRARIDIRAGSWPAWWWLPNTGGWPRGGEIDMMEFYQGKCLFNVMDGNQKWTAPTKTVASLGGAAWAAEYHVWTMEWDSTRIDLFLDGTLMNHYVVANADGTGPNGGNPFRQPGYMILNQALGGTNGGNPSGTAFPVDLSIDWVRVHAWTAGTAFKVTVIGGMGSGTYLEGTSASITALMPPSGQEFDKWLVVAGDPVIDAMDSPSAKLTLPATDITVSAAFRPKATGIRFPRAGRVYDAGLDAPPLFDARGRQSAGIPFPVMAPVFRARSDGNPP